MSDTTVVPERTAQRAKSTRRGGPAGRQVVGEYVGQPAGEAAQAVRRAGLCPGLDRSFGCEPNLIGLVVAQEPVAGSDLARNGMVTLYVAAPGSGPTDEDPPAANDTTREEPEPPASTVETRGQALVAEPVSAPRRRRPGLAQRAPQVFDPPPAPIPHERERTVVLAHEASTTEDHSPPVDRQLEDAPEPERTETEISHDDEFVVHLDDVLAGRSGRPAWRRMYPRRARAPRVWGWLGERSLLVKVLSVALAAWIAVAILSVLDDGQHTRSATASVTPKHEHHSTHERQPRVRSIPPPARVHHSPAHARARGVHAPTRRRRAPSPRPAPAPTREVSAAVRRASAQAGSPPPAAAPAAPVSAPPAPEPAQSQGGPFSP